MSTDVLQLDKMDQLWVLHVQSRPDNGEEHDVS